MIVVDTNVLVYLHLPGPQRQAARDLLSRNPSWVAPRLWRSEMNNALLLYIRRGELTLDAAVATQSSAEFLMRENEYDVHSPHVLELAASSGCSAYDCEFVALARHLGVPLYTGDRRLISAFPDLARPLEGLNN